MDVTEVPLPDTTWPVAHSLTKVKIYRDLRYEFEYLFVDPSPWRVGSNLCDPGSKVIIW